jgi:hypothetical protein
MRLVVTKRNVNVVQAKSPGATIKPDDYLTKLVKYIPSEVVVLYVTLYGIASAAKEEISFAFISWLIFVVGIFGTVLYLWRVAKVSDSLQLIISTIAFVVWVFALGGPFASLSWYHPIYGALLLPVYTFFIPVIIGD